jgi:hypothetical protein
MMDTWTLKASEISRSVSRSRRDFLHALTGAVCYRSLFSISVPPPGSQRSNRRAIVVTFGGGCRDEETFLPQGQENIPHLLKELLPQGTFFTRVENRGILGHYVATASLTTGVYETFDNFASVPPQNPTIFEYFRRDLKRPSNDAWVVAPSNGFNRIGSSDARSFGPGYGAKVILPKRFLKQALASRTTADYEHLLQDNYETPLFIPQIEETGISLREFAGLLNLSATDFVAHARTLSSPDELSLYVAKQIMRRYAPNLLWITLHDMESPMPVAIHCISKRSNAPTAFAVRFGERFKVSRSMLGKHHYSSCRISAAIRMAASAETGSSTTAQATRFLAPRGC